MSAKVKLISIISAFVLVLGIMIIGVLSAEQVQVNIGGSVSFNATNVYAKVSGNISRAKTGNKTFSTLTYSAEETTGNESDWTNLELNFDSDATPILIEITVENLSTDRELQVSLENDIQANGLNISITKDSQPYTAGQTAMLAKSTGDGTSTTTFVMSLTVANPDEDLTDANFNYILNLTDETAIKEITVQSADSSMGSVTGSGTFVIGDQVTLTATPGQDYLFTEWRANSAEGERVSSSSTYTFTLTSISPTTYYAVFEQAQPGTLTYKYSSDTEAVKTATVSGCTSGANVVVIPETTLYNGKTYTVTGIGTSSSSPFSSTRSTLKSITIPSTIETIGNDAFFNCRALTEINYNATAANDLSEDNYVFYNAGQDGEGITVNIGANVTKIPSYIFYPHNNMDCLPNITTVNFAEGSVCESIGNYAFRSCSSLTSVNFGNNSQLTSIGECAFENCHSLTSITIPDSVTSIGDSAFRNCGSLTSITIGKGVTNIGDWAFGYCSRLTEINYNAINANDLSKDNAVFQGAGQDGEGIIVNIGANVTRLPNYIFAPDLSAYYSPNITTVNFAEGSVCESIGGSAFRYCCSLTSITIPSSVTSIYEYAFSSCYNLTSITIPSSVTSIYEDAFFGCYALAEVYNYSTSFTVPQGKSDSSVGYLGCYAKVVYNANDLSSGKPETRITVANNVQYYNYGDDFIALAPTSRYVIEVILKDTTTEINQYAFSRCRSLTSITIPEGVTSISGNAFSYCSRLTSITIPDSVTRIGDFAFFECTSLTSITIGEGVTSINHDAFNNCSSLTSIEVDPANTAYSSEDGVLFNKAKTALIQYPIGNTRTLYKIPDTVASIENNAFEGCRSLTSITIPESVTSIGSLAFEGCRSLTSITIPSSVTSIGDNAFRYCSNLNSITINATTPPTLGSNAIPSSETNIYVPEDSVSAYQAASGWSSYSSKISAIV